MDRGLKERIVGAIVLVVFAVLVVPVFLDGPSPAGEVITERLPLPGQENTETKVIVLERDREAPVPQALPEVEQREPAPADTDAQSIAEQPVQTVKPADPEPVSADEPSAVAAGEQIEQPARRDPVQAIEATVQSATGMWAVQLGSFSSKQNADQLARDLRRQGFAAFLSETAGASGPLHRVRVGPQKDRPAAEAMLARLKEIEQSGQVVPHP